MRAVIQATYGGPEVLQLRETERPRAGNGEVLIQVHASTVTEGDRRLRAADFPGLSAVLGRLVTGVRSPRQPVGGSTFAGRVVEVGAGVSHLEPGDDVFGTTMHGAYAEYLTMPVRGALARMPRNVSYAEAAAIPYGAGTALYFLRDLARLQAGERVLVVGASGGVGRMAVQVAKHLGAHVTGVCSRDADLVRELGADEVIDYTREDFRGRGEKWDVIFDTTQGDHFRGVRGNLTRRGRYLTLYLTLRSLWEMALTRVRSGPRALTGVALGSPSQSDDLRALVEQGALRATIARRFALEDIAEAHAFQQRAGAHGSVVVDVATALGIGRASEHDRCDAIGPLVEVG